MDQQKKHLVGIILKMVKEIYHKTSHLETIFASNSIHILSRDFDPFNELLNIFKLPEDKNTLLLELVQLYLENQMTLDELLLELENQVNALQEA